MSAARLFRIVDAVATRLAALTRSPVCRSPP